MAKIIRIDPVLQPEEVILSSLYGLFGGTDLLTADSYKAEKESYGRRAVEKLQKEKEDKKIGDPIADMLLQHLKEKACLELPFAKRVCRRDRTFADAYVYFMDKAYHWAKALYGGESLYHRVTPTPENAVLHAWIEEYYLSGEASRTEAGKPEAGTGKKAAKKAGKRGGRKAEKPSPRTPANKTGEGEAEAGNTEGPAAAKQMETVPDEGLPWDDETRDPARAEDRKPEGGTPEGTADPDERDTSPLIVDTSKRKAGEVEGQLSFNFF